MKLSDLKNEQAIEAFADLLEPFAEIFSDEEVVKDIQADKPKLLIVKKAMKNHKKAVVQIFAILNGESSDTYTLSFLDIPKILVELFSDEAFVSLFTSQGQNEKENASGSATVNTEEKEI